MKYINRSLESVVKELIKSNFISGVLSTIFSAGTVFGIGASFFSFQAGNYQIAIIYGIIGIVSLAFEIYIFYLVIKNINKSKNNKNI